MNEITRKVQALLFTAGEAVEITDIQKLVGVSAEELQTVLIELSRELEMSGLSLITTGTHTELVTHPNLTEFLQQFNQEESTQLSAAAAETLAIIAYRGPISRYDVDMIRGVDSRRMIRGLLVRGVVQRLHEAGRTPLYDITEEFLKHIGITKREDLPQFTDLHTNEAITKLLHKP